jgi:hypothetical protein
MDYMEEGAGLVLWWVGNGGGEVGIGKSVIGKKIIGSEGWTYSYASFKGDGEVLGYAFDCTVPRRLGTLFSPSSLLLALVLSRYEMYLLHDSFPPSGHVRDGGGYLTCFCPVLMGGE